MVELNKQEISLVSAGTGCPVKMAAFAIMVVGGMLGMQSKNVAKVYCICMAAAGMFYFVYRSYRNSYYTESKKINMDTV